MNRPACYSQGSRHDTDPPIPQRLGFDRGPAPPRALVQQRSQRGIFVSNEFHLLFPYHAGSLVAASYLFKLFFLKALGLRTFYHVAGNLRAAQELGDQLLNLAESAEDLTSLMIAHRALGATLFLLNQTTRLWHPAAQGEKTQAVRSERSRPSGEVEERAASGLSGLRLRCATLRPNGKRLNCQ
jgi:hypothetical protein